MKNPKDSLGDRMKSYYEKITKYFLPRRTHTIIRIDGKAFHTYTKGLKRPFDSGLIEDMNETAKYLCENIQGAKFGYVQSDEISILMTDFDTIKTGAWFEGNVQKIASISASLATGIFNKLRRDRFEDQKDGFMKPPSLAFFDSRVFTIAQTHEVKNYFLWRQQDCVRNSISSVAQSLYSHTELNGKKCNQMQEMIFQKNINWDKYDAGLKRGRVIYRAETLGEFEGTKFTRNIWKIGSSNMFSCEEGTILDDILYPTK